MKKERMTESEKTFYWKVWGLLKRGIKPSEMPGPMWNKWTDLQLNKTL